ncbi:MAG: hypothetical protein ACE360_11345 [Hyphomicrobiales bacterium]
MMMIHRQRANLLGAVATAALVIAATQIADANDQSALQIQGFDMSESFPVAVHDRSAEAAGSVVARHVATLSPGDEVWLRSFGLAGVMDQEINVSVTLGARVQERPRRMAQAIGQLVGTIPQRVRSGDLAIQNRTNIVGFLEAIGSSLNCMERPTTLVLFTDGIEWSSQVRGDDLLAGTADLPTPSGAILEGCHVEMRGLGQVVSDQNTDSRWFPLLRDKWSVFFAAAGVATFNAYATFD